MNVNGTDPNLTELVFLLDRSGSMGGMESDTIGGFNSVLAKHRAAPGRAFVSTVLFDHETLVLHDRVDIADVKPLTHNDYEVRGSTALLDAVAGSVRHIDQVQRYMPVGYKAGHVIFVIVTDGYENASRHATRADVRKAIREHEAQGWEFIFLGANIDAEEQAGELGIAGDRAVTYVCDCEGTQAMYEAVAAFSCSQRLVPTGAPRQDASWKASVERDRARRGHHSR
jgi:uncharacterized protein YegL